VRDKLWEFVEETAEPRKRSERNIARRISLSSCLEIENDSALRKIAQVMCEKGSVEERSPSISK
jgi:hypothetical protein